VEKPFGWLKQIGPLKKSKLRGLAKETPGVPLKVATPA
jgi:hypothetical protein